MSEGYALFMDTCHLATKDSDDTLYEKLYTPCCMGLPDSPSSYVPKEPDKASKDKEQASPTCHVLPDSPVSLSSKDICDKLDQDLMKELDHDSLPDVHQAPTLVPEPFEKMLDQEQSKHSVSQGSNLRSDKPSPDPFDDLNSPKFPSGSRSALGNSRMPDRDLHQEHSLVGDTSIDSPCCSTAFKECASPQSSPDFQESASPCCSTTFKEHDASPCCSTTFQDCASSCCSTTFQGTTSSRCLTALQERDCPCCSTAFQKPSENLHQDISKQLNIAPCYINLFKCNLFPEKHLKKSGEHSKQSNESVKNSDKHSKVCDARSKNVDEHLKEVGEHSKKSGECLEKSDEDLRRENGISECVVSMKPLPLVRDVAFKARYSTQYVAHVIRMGFNKYRHKNEVDWKKVYDKHLKTPFCALSCDKFQSIAKKSVEDYFKSQKLKELKRRRDEIIKQKENEVRRKTRVYYDGHHYVLVEKREDVDVYTRAVQNMKWCKVVCETIDR